MSSAKRGGPTVAKRLREARIEAGISQRELGVRAGIDPSVASPRINQYERGKHLPDPTTLERLGNVLDRPLPYFYAADDTLAAFIIAFASATAAQRRRLATYLTGASTT
ncbi:helix-turn-helix transcriptional regulator [Dokdonella sp.]|uniref:helix-turn-helix domain-containing protein n=1 Tax=Dokdonella sp. TaxID=2291710 RepID=UPI001B1B227A|nr:helix-turn-helix transcriptional regulator [Dokdonella sp.]MBO9664951.1 helix-turn-helix transcriptional regulator [Dokdonella sp.]